MGVYFSLRTHYDFLTGKYLKYFPNEDTVLAWFQKHWHEYDEDSPVASIDNILGTGVYGFDSLFEAIWENDIPRPRTEPELAEVLQEQLYAEGDIFIAPHAIQVKTDDDELELAYFFFDDFFVAKNPEKTAYLLYDEWQLPTGTASELTPLPTLPEAIETLAPPGNGDGTVFGTLVSFYDSANFDDIHAFQMPGIRLPEFADYLKTALPDEDWYFELSVLRALTVPREGEQTSPRTLEEILHEAGTLPIPRLSDPLYKLGFGQDQATPETDRSRLAQALGTLSPDHKKGGMMSLIQAEEHMAQVCLHAEVWERPSGTTDLFMRWIFFDDLWLRANPVLGNAILVFGIRWDVLT